MWRPMTRHARSVPVTFVSKIAFHSESGTSRVGVRLVRPAQLTRISTLPNSLHAASSNCLMVDSSVTSHGVSSERRPRARISFAAAFTRSARRPVATTSAPACARPFAISSPMPLVPPMTSADLLLRSSRGWPNYLAPLKQRLSPGAKGPLAKALVRGLKSLPSKEKSRKSRAIGLERRFDSTAAKERVRNANHGRESNRLLPWPEFCDVEGYDGRRNLRLGRRYAERARACRCELPDGPRDSDSDWARRPANRRYLAIPL